MRKEQLLSLTVRKKVVRSVRGLRTRTQTSPVSTSYSVMKSWVLPVRLDCWTSATAVETNVSVVDDATVVGTDEYVQACACCQNVDRNAA